MGVSKKLFKFFCLVSRLCSFIMAVSWSHLGEFPLLSQEEESDRDMNMFGLGSPHKHGYVDAVELGRSSGLGEAILGG